MVAYSFDIERTPPFMAFRILREIARKSVGESDVLDLSQGEPGYGFSPNVRSRRFFSFILMLDIEFNDHLYRKTLFAYRKPEEIDAIDQKIRDTAFALYEKNLAQELLDDFEDFIQKLMEIFRNQKLNYSRFDLIYEIFKYSNLAGGRYPEPTGQILLQAATAEEYTNLLGVKVWHDELISVLGASHGVGTVFKGLGHEGLNFLHAGDYVLMTSPVYAPYNLLFKQRGINVLSLSINPETGEFDTSQVEDLKKFITRIKCIILIDPNNPTGFGGDENFLKTIVDIAEVHNSLIVTDEVYYRFFKNKKSIISIPEAQKRTIRIDSISKIERSTGLRSGHIYISKAANKFITEKIVHSYLGDYDDFFTYMRFAKSPSGKNIGLFQHITGIPGPSIGLTLAHLLLGKEERGKATEMIQEKMELFYRALGIDYRKNFYYGIFDISKIESEKWQSVDIEKKLETIAEKGVVLMPAYLFFSETDHKKQNCKNYVRVSLPNLSFKNTERAAQIIKEVLTT